MKSNDQAYQLLVLIATHKLADKAADMFSKKHLPIQYRLNAQGTASSEIMDTLGLGSIDKCILVSTVTKSMGNGMLKLLHSQLRLDAVNSGIAFTIPLTGASNIMLRMMNHAGEKSGFSENGKGGNIMIKIEVKGNGGRYEVETSAEIKGYDNAVSQFLAVIMSLHKTDRNVLIDAIEEYLKTELGDIDND